MDDKTLIERLSENPEAIAELSREELTTARTELAEAGREQAGIAKDSTAEHDARKQALEAAKEAADRLATVDARLAEFAEADADLETAAAELETAFAEEEVEEEIEEVEEVVAEVTDEEIAEVIEAETVTATVASIGALAKRTPKPVVESPVLTANAGPAISGQYSKFTTPEEIGDAALKVWKSYGSSKTDAKALVASFDTGSKYKFEVTGDARHDGEVIDQLLKDVRYEAQKDARKASLVASGGICAPSQPVYDFFSISARDGLISLPGVSAPRGSLTYPVSTSYADIAATAAWVAAVAQEHTNADDIAGATKANFHVECPDVQTCTIAAYPVILEFGNFAQRFYPEHVAHAIAESMTFHTHFMNGTFIADMVALSTAVNGGDTGGGGLVNVANLIGFEAAKYRDTYRMDMDATLELVAPSWVRDALVADYVARNATVDFANTRSRVDAVFSNIGVNVQWVQDWQSIGDAGDDGWRLAADFILYAPGTFVRLDGGTLDLGIVRDSTLNATNDFQTFVESFEAICEIGHDSWLIDDVTICPRGRAALDVALDCNPGFGS